MVMRDHLVEDDLPLILFWFDTCKRGKKVLRRRVEKRTLYIYS